MWHIDDPEPKTIEKGTYRHGKTGHLYEVLGVALQTETGEQLVIYRPLYDSKFELFARPFDVFAEEVEQNGKLKHRFERID